ncbi:MAG: hypothetical protein QW705_01575 [Zestosphaera sp.]
MGSLTILIGSRHRINTSPQYVLISAPQTTTIFLKSLAVLDARIEPRNELWSVTDITLRPFLREYLTILVGEGSPSLTYE